MDKRMMNHWLAAKSQNPITEAEIQRRRLGINLNEQLSSKEKAYAESHKAKVREDVKKNKD